MSSMQTIASYVPHEYRVKILLEWLPVATPDMANAAMQNLFNAWFVFVEPDGIQKPNCPKCVNNILENWKQMNEALAEEERAYNLLNEL